MRRTVVFAGVLAFVACHTGGSAPAPVASSAPAVSSAPLTFATTAPTVTPGAPLPRVERLFDAPALVNVRVYDAQNEPAKAAQLIAEVRAGIPYPDAAATASTAANRTRCTLAYAEAKRWAIADQPGEARAALDDATRDVCPLRDYAKVMRAELFVRAREGQSALGALPAVAPKPIAEDVELLRADALLLTDARPEAARIYRTWIAAHTKGARYGEIAVRFAEAGLAGAFTNGEPWADEAHVAVTRALVDFPRWAQKMNAADVLGRVATISHRSTDLTLSDRVRRAALMLDATGMSARNELVQIAAGAPSEASCKAASVLAASPKKGDKSDGWETAIIHCAGDLEVAAVLYNGAKDAAKRRDDTLAIARFARVEQEFPTHRLADDSRFRAAMIYRDRGDDVRYVAMLSSLPGAYPEGDMKNEARFRVALLHAEQKRWPDVGTVLDDGLAESCKDRHWATAGRVEFFRARAAQKTGDVARARELFAHVVEERSLYFYGLRAYARLRALDPQAAEKALEKARSRSAALAFPAEAVLVDVASGESERALAFLSIEEGDAAKRELTGRNKNADWSAIAGHWLDEGGAFDLGHAFARASDPPFLDSFPYGGARHAWEAAYPAAFAPLVEVEAARNGVPKSLVWAIMREESDFVADARSHSNAIGLMQFMVPTAKWIASGTTYAADEASLKKPDVAIALGARLLAKLRTQFPQNPWLAIPAYNSGKGSVDRWMNQMGTLDLETFVEKIPYDETRNYVKRVLMSQAVYATLYETDALRDVFELGATWPEGT